MSGSIYCDASLGRYILSVVLIVLVFMFGSGWVVMVVLSALDASEGNSMDLSWSIKNVMYLVVDNG